MSLQPSASGRQPGSSRAGPRDSAALRQQLAARAPLLSCEQLLFSDNPMTIASIATGHCPASEVRGDACYLLSQDRLAGSHRSLDCLALRRDRRNRNLPTFHAWGFVAPRCWSYVEILRRAFRPPRLMPPGADNRLAHLARDAVQGWAHPDQSGRLRVAVLGSCLPFLLDDVPHLLGQGDERHDAVSTTITRSRGSFEEKRHLSVVRLVMVDADAAHALARARHTHAAALNPLVTGVNEVEDAHAREFRRLRRTVRGAGTVLLLNVLVIALNIVVIWRGMCSWETRTLSPNPSPNPGPNPGHHPSPHPSPHTRHKPSPHQVDLEPHPAAPARAVGAAGLAPLPRDHAGHPAARHPHAALPRPPRAARPPCGGEAPAHGRAGPTRRRPRPARGGRGRGARPALGDGRRGEHCAATPYRCVIR